MKASQRSSLNVPETAPEVPALASRVEIIVNWCQGVWHKPQRRLSRDGNQLFCILNPDVSLIGDPFPQLVGALGEVPVSLRLLSSPRTDPLKTASGGFQISGS